jgi:predicted 2-oxoglutarate/Fe(II)-dependent dioxygenase YbiX
MMLHIPQVLNKHQVAELREQIQQQSVWIDGTHSAGPQAQKLKIIYKSIYRAMYMNLLAILF